MSDNENHDDVQEAESEDEEISTETTSKATQNFGVLLTQLHSGAVNARVSDDFARLMTVLQHQASKLGKARGTYTLQLDVKVRDNGGIIITYKSKTKEPEIENGEVWAWFDASGHLVNQEPRQQMLSFREVKAKEAKPKAVAAPKKAKSL